MAMLIGGFYLGIEEAGGILSGRVPDPTMS
jgi:hypothetical protein